MIFLAGWRRLNREVDQKIQQALSKLRCSHRKKSWLQQNVVLQLQHTFLLAVQYLFERCDALCALPKSSLTMLRAVVPALRWGRRRWWLLFWGFRRWSRRLRFLLFGWCTGLLYGRLRLRLKVIHLFRFQISKRLIFYRSFIFSSSWIFQSIAESFVFVHLICFFFFIRIIWFTILI